MGSTEETERSDDQLMEALVDRKSEALEYIYARYESLLCAVILGVIRGQSEVDDIVHDVLLRLWEREDRYNPSSGGLRELLVALARRCALDRLQRRAANRREDHEITTLMVSAKSGYDRFDEGSELISKK
jgi:RNA polymerase sigma factor (sigma-70 family)